MKNDFSSKTRNHQKMFDFSQPKQKWNKLVLNFFPVFLSISGRHKRITKGCEREKEWGHSERERERDGVTKEGCLSVNEFALESICSIARDPIIVCEDDPLPFPRFESLETRKSKMKFFENNFLTDFIKGGQWECAVSTIYLWQFKSVFEGFCLGWEKSNIFDDFSFQMKSHFSIV